MRLEDNRMKSWEEQFNETGFDDTVTWSLDHSLVIWLLPRLKRYREIIGEALVNSNNFYEDVDFIIEGFELMLSKEYNDCDEKQYKRVSESFEKLASIHGRLWW